MATGGGTSGQDRGPPIEIEVGRQDAVKARLELDKQREDLRGELARILIWALVLFLGFALLSSWISMVPDNRQALLDVLQLIVGPMIGLVGAVIGFYYGEKKG